MVRPNRKDETVAVKVYYRDQFGVMRAIKDVFMTIYQDNPGVIVYINPKGRESRRLDLK